METATYVFTDIPFLDNHSPYFFKNGLKLLKDKALEIIPNFCKSGAQSWPQGRGKKKNI